MAIRKLPVAEGKSDFPLSEGGGQGDCKGGRVDFSAEVGRNPSTVAARAEKVFGCRKILTIKESGQTLAMLD